VHFGRGSELAELASRERTPVGVQPQGVCCFEKPHEAACTNTEARARGHPPNTSTLFFLKVHSMSVPYARVLQAAPLSPPEQIIRSWV
jgi:hypothetical protein